MARNRKRAAPHSNDGVTDGRWPKRNRHTILKSGDTESGPDTTRHNDGGAADGTAAVRHGGPEGGATKAKSASGLAAFANPNSSKTKAKANAVTAGVPVSPVPSQGKSTLAKARTKAHDKPNLPDKGQSQDQGGRHEQIKSELQHRFTASKAKDNTDTVSSAATMLDLKRYGENGYTNGQTHAAARGQDGSRFQDNDMDVDTGVAADETGAFPHLTHLPLATQGDLRGAYNLKTMKISSSSSISKRVTQLITHLSRIDMLDQSSRPGVVLLHADSSAAGKLISVVEIAKREIAKLEKGASVTDGGRGGIWFQYSRVDGVLKEVKKTNGTSGQTTSIVTGQQGPGSSIANTIGGAAVGGPKGFGSGDTLKNAAATQTSADATEAPADGSEASEAMQGIDAHASAVGEPAQNEAESSSEDEEVAFESIMSSRAPGRSGAPHQGSGLRRSGPAPAAGRHQHEGEDTESRPIRADPVMTIFMSRVRVPALEATLGIHVPGIEFIWGAFGLAAGSKTCLPIRCVDGSLGCNAGGGLG